MPFESEVIPLDCYLVSLLATADPKVGNPVLARIPIRLY